MAEFEGGVRRITKAISASGRPEDQTMMLFKRPDGQPASLPRRYRAYYERKGFVEADPLDFDDVIPAKILTPKKMTRPEMRATIEDSGIQRRLTLIAELELPEGKKPTKKQMEIIEAEVELTRAETKKRVLGGSQKVKEYQDPGTSLGEGLTSSMEELIPGSMES